MGRKFLKCWQRNNFVEQGSALARFVVAVYAFLDELSLPDDDLASRLLSVLFWRGIWRGEADRLSLLQLR
jgi:hypothetical protein